MRARPDREHGALIGENAIIAVVDRRLAAVAASVGPEVR
jgi:hypothetical protein